MGLPKLDAGRHHEIRSGKSYLYADLSWDDDTPITCPRCGESPETFAHTILS